MEKKVVNFMSTVPGFLLIFFVSVLIVIISVLGIICKKPILGMALFIGNIYNTVCFQMSVIFLS